MCAMYSSRLVVTCILYNIVSQLYGDPNNIVCDTAAHHKHLKNKVPTIYII